MTDTKLSWKFERGDVVKDVQTGRTHRVERRMVDVDTGARIYGIRNEDADRELQRNAKLIENPHCFIRALPPRGGL
jgi:hypothetical protein